MSDTVGSSWQDDGVDVLTDNDSVTGQSDTFEWNQFSSVTDGASESNGGTVSGEGMQSVSVGDTGSETLAADESESGSLTVAAESDMFNIQDALSAGQDEAQSWSESDLGYSDDGASGQGCMTLSAADGYRFGDVGNDSLADTSSIESDSYGVSDWLWSSESLTDSGDLPDGTYGSGAYMTDVDDLGSYSLTADGTDSVSGGHDLSTMNDDIGVSSSVGGSFSFHAPVAYGYIDQFGDGFFAGTIYGFEESGGPSSSAESYAGVSIDYGLYYPGPFSWSSAQGNDTHLVGEVTPMTPSYFPGPVWANASAGSPLSMIEEDQLPDGVVGVTSESGTLYLSGPRVKDDFTAGGGTSSSSGGPNSYRVPDSAPVFLTGSRSTSAWPRPPFFPTVPLSGWSPPSTQQLPQVCPIKKPRPCPIWPKTKASPTGSRMMPRPRRRTR